MRASYVVACGLVLLANLVFWGMAARPDVDEPSWTVAIRGFSYTPWQRDQDPRRGDRPSAQGIARDMDVLSQRAARVRTYAARDGLESVVMHAGNAGMRVTAGAWVGGKYDEDIAEIRRLAEVAAQYPVTVERVIVGNEAMLRADVDILQMTAYLKLARALIHQPVSTAEPWHVWLDHPELAEAVDFISIHVLPYWEGISVDEAVDYVLSRYRQVKAAFPGKPVVITEVGWPSDGRTRRDAVASLQNQAAFTRRFLSVAYAEGIDYFMMEATDQPWKITLEGAVGAYWGIYDAERNPKFALAGPVAPMPAWQVPAVASTLFAMLGLVWFLGRNREIGWRGALMAGVLVQAVATGLAWTLYVGASQYLRPVDLALWTVVLSAQLLLYARLFAEGFEITELLTRPAWRRHFTGFRELPAGRKMPKVSLHLAICREPPDMVIETLRSLARLDYPDYEVIVVDNNTADAQLWRPVEEACRELGPRFRFFHLETWPGFKAGALNFALRHTAQDAEVVGVIDSDYVVEPNWLVATVPYFLEPKVGFVQAPQDHRDWRGNGFKTMCNWEYAGFFHTGMVHRNERNAIIQHGTMTLIRREALDRLGGWAEWCICEDAELGLRLMDAGYDSVYLNEVYGRGVTPDSYPAYRGQRFRWAFGAMQILRHYRGKLAGLQPSGLTTAQRFHFIGGWLPWFTDAIGLVFTGLALLWSFGLVAFPHYIDFPLALFVVPTIGMFTFRALATLALYRARVDCTPVQMLGALVGGLSLTYAIGRAVLIGCWTDKRPFLRTPKMETASALTRSIAQVWEETAILAALVVAAVAVRLTYPDDKDALIWAAVLGVQATPFAAALGASLLAALPAGFLRRRSAAAAEPAAVSAAAAPAASAQAETP